MSLASGVEENDLVWKDYGTHGIRIFDEDLRQLLMTLSDHLHSFVLFFSNPRGCRAIWTWLLTNSVVRASYFFPLLLLFSYFPSLMDVKSPFSLSWSS